MTSEQRKSTPSISYEVWKLRLQKDCEALNKLLAFHGLGDHTLRILWEEGIDPSVAGIMAGDAAPKDGYS